MKTSDYFPPGLTLSHLVTIFSMVLVFTSCTGKSNAEDDTFRQSIIDDPVKAQDQNEAAKIGKKKLTDTVSTDSLNR